MGDEEVEMLSTWLMVVIAQAVLDGGCVTVGFLLGIACWQEREARRVRREARARLLVTRADRPS